MAEYRRAPWGEGRADLQTALICQVVAECLTGRRQKFSSFLLNFDPAPKQTPMQMQNIFKTWVTAHNARVRRKRK